MVDLLRDPSGRVRTTSRRSGAGPPRRTYGAARAHAGAGGADRGRGPLVAPLWLLLLVVALASGCASGAPSGEGEGGADAGRPAAAAETDAEEDAAAEGRRAASDRMVVEGRTALEDGRLAEAASRLERAVRVDPSNGRAYLALAEVRIAEGRPRAAEGLLERALTLLEADSAPAARADSLLEELEGRPD